MALRAGRHGRAHEQIVDLVPLRAIAHAELDTEVDTEAIEQHGEID